MSQTNAMIKSNESNPTWPENGRSEWERPALHRLKASEAQKAEGKSNDGIAGGKS